MRKFYVRWWATPESREDRWRQAVQAEEEAHDAAMRRQNEVIVESLLANLREAVE